MKNKPGRNWALLWAESWTIFSILMGIGAWIEIILGFGLLGLTFGWLPGLCLAYVLNAVVNGSNLNPIDDAP